MATDDAPTNLPRLVYVDGRGLAELARLMFVAKGVAYVDERSAGAAALKPTGRLPFDQIPVLELPNGFTIAQSQAIYRYIAREYGLYGANNLEAAKIDMICEVLQDLRTAHSNPRLIPEEKKAAETTTIGEETLPRWMGYLEKLLKANHNGEGFFVGDAITMADLAVQNFVFAVKPMYPTILDHAPTVAAHYDRISAYPGVAEWIKKRPVTQF